MLKAVPGRPIRASALSRFGSRELDHPNNATQSRKKGRDWLLRPASEKRQGTKSRKVGHLRCSRRYGDLAAA